jgi:zinc transport system substrate-binding protein
MKNIVEEAKKNKIKVIFSEPQTNRQSALAVAHEIGANIDFINPHPAKYLNNFIEVSNKLLESFK